MIDIAKYLTGPPLHKEFISGQTPPPYALNSIDMLDWYQTQIDRVTNPKGFTYKGTRMTMFHYWFLNFTPFKVFLKDSKGNITSDYETSFPYWNSVDDYIFKCMEEAFEDEKGIFLMGGRGFGKTYIMLAVLSWFFTFAKKSHSVISATNDGHASECFGKMKDMLDAINKAHPMIGQNRYKDNSTEIRGGDEVLDKTSGTKSIEGVDAYIEKIVYGTNEGITKGRRLIAQLIEEAADFTTGKGNLKGCLGASRGTWWVGDLRVCIAQMLIGTGGTVRSGEARDIFMNPEAYELYGATIEQGKPCGLFIPTYYKYGGFYETGYPDYVAAKAKLESLREKKKAVPEEIAKFTQEYPYTPQECFKQRGTNSFNQDKIAEQRVRLDFNEDVAKPDVGMLEWVRNSYGKVTGVRFVKNPAGDIHILEHPELTEIGEKYNDLYVGGIDSIDMGASDSVVGSDGSKLCMMVKKRIVDGAYFSKTSNLYVCMYNKRSKDVRDDYENCAKITLYYNAQVNLEYTRIGIVAYFKEIKMYDYLMKRPAIALGNSSGKQVSNLVGTPASTHVIDHQDELVKEYIDDYYYQIYFPEALEELQEYQREDRRRYDAVIAMGLCELADEDKTGIRAEPTAKPPSDKLRPWGCYIDSKGRKRHGVIPDKQDLNLKFKNNHNDGPVRWVDSDGTPHFED